MSLGGYILFRRALPAVSPRDPCAGHQLRTRGAEFRLLSAQTFAFAAVWRLNEWGNSLCGSPGVAAPKLPAQQLYFSGKARLKLSQATGDVAASVHHGQYNDRSSVRVADQ